MQPTNNNSSHHNSPQISRLSDITDSVVDLQPINDYNRYQIGSTDFICK